MTDDPGELDEHRGMAAQKLTEIRRRLNEVQADQAALRRRQEEFECHALAAPSTTWARGCSRGAISDPAFRGDVRGEESETPRIDREGARRSRPLIRLNRDNELSPAKTQVRS